MTIETILDIVQDNQPTADLNSISLAYNFLANILQDSNTNSSQDILRDSLQTAYDLAQPRQDIPKITSGILRHLPDNNLQTTQNIQDSFGQEIANLVSDFDPLDLGLDIKWMP